MYVYQHHQCCEAINIHTLKHTYMANDTQKQANLRVGFTRVRVWAQGGRTRLLLVIVVTRLPDITHAHVSCTT